MRGGTCRCPMCGRKEANSHHGRGLYFRWGIECDEDLARNPDDRKFGARRLRRKLNNPNNWER